MRSLYLLPMLLVALVALLSVPLANAQFGIDHLATGQNLTLLANYFDDRIFEVERSGTNVIEDGRVVVDLVYKWMGDKGFSVKAKVGNLLDSKVSYSRADDEIESYREGTSIKVGMEWKTP